MWNDNFKENAIKNLLRQSSRWAIAAKQAKSPIITLLHANYAAGYLWALKDIAAGNDIKSTTGIDIIKFKQKITDIQDMATKNVQKICPTFKGDLDDYLLKIAGDK